MGFMATAQTSFVATSLAKFMAKFCVLLAFLQIQNQLAQVLVEDQ